MVRTIQPEKGEAMKVFVLQSIEQGTAGDEIELPDDIAERFIAAGYVMPVDEEKVIEEAE